MKKSDTFLHNIHPGPFDPYGYGTLLKLSCSIWLYGKILYSAVHNFVTVPVVYFILEIERKRYKEIIFTIGTLGIIGI